MKILVTGAGGFLGTVLCKKLLDKGCDVLALDNLFRGNADYLISLCSDSKFEFILGSVNDEKLIKPLLEKVDCVCNLASLVGEPICRRFPELATIVNVNGIRTICKNKPEHVKLIQFSTGSVYGALGETCTEESPTNPVSHYGVTKLEAEKIVLDTPNTKVHRYSTAYGLSGNHRINLLINTLVYNAVHDGTLTVFQPDHMRSFINSSDLVDAVIFTYENFDRMTERLFNVGDPEGNWTKRMIAKYLKERLGVYVSYADSGYEDPDKRDYSISFERIMKYGWKPRISMKDGIEQLIKAAKLINVRHQYA